MDAACDAIPLSAWPATLECGSDRCRLEPALTATWTIENALNAMDRFALFPTPLFVYDVPNVEDINRELGERLRAEAQASPGVRRANVGGWHSPPDLALRPEPCYRAMMKMIVDHVGETHSKIVSAK